MATEIRNGPKSGATSASGRFLMSPSSAKEPSRNTNWQCRPMTTLGALSMKLASCCKSHIGCRTSTDCGNQTDPLPKWRKSCWRSGTYAKLRVLWVRRETQFSSGRADERYPAVERRFDLHLVANAAENSGNMESRHGTDLPDLRQRSAIRKQYLARAQHQPPALER